MNFYDFSTITINNMKKWFKLARYKCVIGLSVCPMLTPFNRNSEEMVHTISNTEIIPLTDNQFLLPISV